MVWIFRYMKMDFLLAISEASASSRNAAKPFICLVYELKMASFAFSSLHNKTKMKGKNYDFIL